MTREVKTVVVFGRSVATSSDRPLPGRALT